MTGWPGRLALKYFVVPILIPGVIIIFIGTKISQWHERVKLANAYEEVASNLHLILGKWSSVTMTVRTA